MVTSLLLFASKAFGQMAPEFKYAPQAKLLPSELGRVYLGIRLSDIAKQIDLSKAYVENDRFSELSIEVPFAKANVAGLMLKVAGVPDESRDAMFAPATAKLKYEDGSGEYEADVKRPLIDMMPRDAFVYAIYVSFKPSFDQRAYVKKMYGKGTERDPKDPYHFSDIEWSKKTSDGLIILIRSLHEDGMRLLQLLGRIKGTEWSIDD